MQAHPVERQRVRPRRRVTAYALQRRGSRGEQRAHVVAHAGHDALDVGDAAVDDDAEADATVVGEAGEARGGSYSKNDGSNGGPHCASPCGVSGPWLGTCAWLTRSPSVQCSTFMPHGSRQ